MRQGQARVAVVGYLSIDLIRAADGAELLSIGGGALYASLAVAAAGLTPVLHVALGSDLPDDLEATLESLGVDCSGVVRRDHPARRVRLAYATQDERASPHFAEEAWWQATRALSPPLPEGLFAASVLSPMPAAAMADVLSRGRDLGPVVADTSEAYVHDEADAIVDLLPELALFAPSLAETRALLPGLDDDDALAMLARQAPGVVQKRGARGLFLARRGSPTLHRRPDTGPLVDTTGAGDSVAGALAAGLAKGLDDAALLDLAAGIAARAVSGRGPEAFGLPAWVGTEVSGRARQLGGPGV